MTPQNARIWFVSPDEPHNKTAYFVNAPYQSTKSRRSALRSGSSWAAAFPVVAGAQPVHPG